LRDKQEPLSSVFVRRFHPGDAIKDAGCRGRYAIAHQTSQQWLRPVLQDPVIQAELAKADSKNGSDRRRERL